MNLKQHQVISPLMLTRNSKIGKKNIYKVVVSYLAKKKHTHFTLGEKLKDKGFNPYLVKRSLKNLSKESFLNDPKFCEILIARRIKQSYGPARIVTEFPYRGVNKKIITSLYSKLIKLDSVFAKSSGKNFRAM